MDVTVRPTSLGIGIGLAAAMIAGLAHAQVIGGFGAQTVGGAGGAVYRVTSLDDGGPGSLRDAVSAGNRTVVFDVAGDIVLRRKLIVGPASAFLTIDGCSAPAPGITIRDGYGLILRETHDVIIRCLRIRNVTGFGDQSQDGISVQYNTRNVLIHHVSIHGSVDGNLDIGAFPAGTSVRDVTVAWSILAEPAGAEKNMLIKYNPSRITLHHNLFVGARQRNPQVRIDDVGTPATETTIDMRNNVIYDWSGCCGTQIWYGPWANVVANYYASPAGDQADALIIGNGARAYVAGNVDGDGIDLNSLGTEASPFPAPAVETQDACTAARLVLDHAGSRPLDAIDQAYLSRLTLGDCVPEPSGLPPSGPPPSGLSDLVVTTLSVHLPRTSLTAELIDTVTNRGTGPAGPSIVKFYLSETRTSVQGAVLLGSRPVWGLDVAATDRGTTTVTIPETASPGRYFIIAVADADGLVPESNESNNFTAGGIRVR